MDLVCISLKYIFITLVVLVSCVKKENIEDWNVIYLSSQEKLMMTTKQSQGSRDTFFFHNFKPQLKYTCIWYFMWGQYTTTHKLTTKNLTWSGTCWMPCDVWREKESLYTRINYFYWREETFKVVALTDRDLPHLRWISHHSDTLIISQIIHKCIYSLLRQN